MTGPEFAHAHGNDSSTWTTADFEAAENLAAIDAHTVRLADPFQQGMYDASEAIYRGLDGARPIDVHAALLNAHLDTSA